MYGRISRYVIVVILTQQASQPYAAGFSALYSRLLRLIQQAGRAYATSCIDPELRFSFYMNSRHELHPRIRDMNKISFYSEKFAKSPVLDYENTIIACSAARCLKNPDNLLRFSLSRRKLSKLFQAKYFFCTVKTWMGFRRGAASNAPPSP